MDMPGDTAQRRRVGKGQIPAWLRAEFPTGVVHAVCWVPYEFPMMDCDGQMRGGQDHDSKTSKKGRGQSTRDQGQVREKGQPGRELIQHHRQIPWAYSTIFPGQLNLLQLSLPLKYSCRFQMSSASQVRACHALGQGPYPYSSNAVLPTCFSLFYVMHENIYLAFWDKCWACFWLEVTNPWHPAILSPPSWAEGDQYLSALVVFSREVLIQWSLPSTLRGLARPSKWTLDQGRSGSFVT